MQKLTISITLSLALSAGIASAEPFPADGWSHSGDDTVRCMAIGCDPSDHERYPEYAPPPGQGFGDAPGYGQPAVPAEPHTPFIPGESYIPVGPGEAYLPVEPGDYAGHAPHFDPEIGELLEQLPLQPTHEFDHAETPQLPGSEDGLRDDYYRALREHANGRGTIEQVEEAYQRLKPFRR